jgi:hypothetical protein
VVHMDAWVRCVALVREKKRAFIVSKYQERALLGPELANADRLSLAAVRTHTHTHTYGHRARMHADALVAAYVGARVCVCACGCASPYVYPFSIVCVRVCAPASRPCRPAVRMCAYFHGVC